MAAATKSVQVLQKARGVEEEGESISPADIKAIQQGFAG